MKKNISVLLALILSCGFVLSAFAGVDAYTISNPYAGVNWESVSQFKAALHSHTNASDGDQTLKESIQRHVETGFDIVAVTDHGVVDYSWADGPDGNIIKTILGIAGRSEGEIVYLGNEGAFDNGVAYTYGEASNGDQYLFTDTGRTVMHMPLGIENNAISVNAHVNSWFSNYSDNSVTIYEDAVKGVNAAGGLCVINHPGEYTKARYELHTSDAYNEDNPAYAYYINKYAYLIENYDGLVGIDMNSKGDNRTRFDRKLWDILLSRFSANGETLFAIASSDAHYSQRNLLRHLIADADSCIAQEKPGVANLMSIMSALDGKTMAEAMALIEEKYIGEYDADESIGIEYSVLDSEGYTKVDTFPTVTGIKVDDNSNTIEIDSENALIVRFISEGNVFETKKADSAVIDLDDYADEVGNYVRAEIFGEGGMIYTQAFILNAEENTGSSSVVKGMYFNIGFIDFLFAELHHWFNIIVRWVTNLF